MKVTASRLRYVVVAWSIVLAGTYVLYMAGEHILPGSKANAPTERVLRGSKSGPIYRPSIHSQETTVLPSSKHAVIGPQILYGNGSVRFEENPFVNREKTKGTTSPSTRP